MTKKTILFDIDGTLAEITHWRKFLEQEKKNWKSFNDKMGDDTLNEPIVGLYKTLWDMGKYEIIIISGRTEKYRELTEQWLFWNDIHFETLKMRPNGDNRADYIIKEEMLERFNSEGKEILFVVDDRQQVVDMWCRNGFTCLQCAEGDF